MKKQIILHYKFPQTVSTVMLVSSAKKIQVKSILSENENVCVHTSQMYRKPVLRLSVCFCLLDWSCCLRGSVWTLFLKYRLTMLPFYEIVIDIWNNFLYSENEQSCDSRGVVQACLQRSWEDCCKCHQNQVYFYLYLCLYLC